MEPMSNADFYSALTVMPLISDGSLCMMEAMNNSQLQGTPKLENFFSRDSMYYHQDMNFVPNSQDFLNIVQSNSRDQQQQFPECFSLKSLELYQRSHDEIKETHPTKDSFFKEWMPMTYNMDTAMEEKMMGSFQENGVEYSSLGAMANGDLQSLSLSMSPGSHSSCISSSQFLSPAMAESCMAIETKKRGPENKQTAHRKSIDRVSQRTSQYRGVTRHRWTGRYEAHLWDNSCKKEEQSKKGRQVYLGGYDIEEKAARAYDLAALKYWGPYTHTNLPSETYRQELEEMKNMTRLEVVAHLRRKSSGFSRGASIYRGVTRHHQHGRWQARIGRVAGNKDLYLGTFGTQEEAAEAYDIAAIKFRGVNSVTNFDITKYDVDQIMASNTLLARQLARRCKNSQSNDPNSSTKEDFDVDSIHQHCHKPLSLDFKNSSFFSVATKDLIVEQVHDADELSNLPVHLEASMPHSSHNPAVNSWIWPNQLRSYDPVFAAWTEDAS